MVKKILFFKSLRIHNGPFVVPFGLFNKVKYRKVFFRDRRKREGVDLQKNWTVHDEPSNRTVNLWSCFGGI